MSLCGVCVCIFVQKRRLNAPELELQMLVDALHRCGEPSSGPPEEQQMLSSPEPSPPPLPHSPKTLGSRRIKVGRFHTLCFFLTVICEGADV